jgi:hypothetical protein
MGKGFIGFRVQAVTALNWGVKEMEKEVRAVDETVTTFVEDGLNASQLSTMNPSELFRLAAELRLAIETMPSSSSQEFRLKRYIE